ncbi:SDR family oxidoreductase [Parasphingorhabdus sp. JC815]|uniref:SDR family oxidoreductase n=1 Tax=Parasphingorhabdus sp. JC815 TaxID=3232140 RepID=UPI003458798D
MGRLEGKKAIILGAAGADNMGQVIAKRFRDEGAEVLVAGRNEDELKRYAKELGGHYAVCDLTKEDDIHALAQAGIDKMGAVDIAVNATGWGLLKPFLENTQEDLTKMSNLQLVGPFQFYQAMIKAMTNPDSTSGDKGGSIIQISSATATIMLNDHAAYMGTKAATDHIIRCVAHEFGEQGVRANSISPGLTRTPMTAGVDQVPGLVEAFEARYPLGRIGTSDDIAAAAVFLASDECFMTGENLQVNGGLCLRGNPTEKDKELMMGAVAAAS